MGEHFIPTPEPKPNEQQEKRSQLEAGFETISSTEHPGRNEDAGYVKKEAGIFGVFDGLGGAPAGDLASRMAMMQLTKISMESAIKHASSPQELQDAIETANTFLADSTHPLTEAAVKKAMRTILKRMAKAIATVTETNDPTIKEAITQYANIKYRKILKHQLNPEDPSDREIIRHAAADIGTTVSFAKIWNDENDKRYITSFQLGDSSIYRLRNGELTKITTDDSLLTDLQNVGLLPSEAEYERQTASSPHSPDFVDFSVSADDIILRLPPNNPLVHIANERKKAQDPESKNEIRLSVHEIRHYVTVHMNNQQKSALMARPTTSEVLDGDVFIAMTDGITDNLTWGEIQSLAERKKDDPEQLALLLTSYAGKRAQQEKPTPEDPHALHPRAKPDDMTAVVIAVT